VVLDATQLWLAPRISAILVAIAILGCEAETHTVTDKQRENPTQVVHETMSGPTTDAISAYLDNIDHNLLALIRYLAEARRQPHMQGLPEGPLPLENIAIIRLQDTVKGDAVTFRGEVNSTMDLDVLLVALGVYYDMSQQSGLPEEVFIDLDLSNIGGTPIRRFMPPLTFIQALKDSELKARNK
jgi:hypothetical protein